MIEQFFSAHLRIDPEFLRKVAERSADFILIGLSEVHTGLSSPSHALTRLYAALTVSALLGALGGATMICGRAMDWAEAERVTDK